MTITIDLPEEEATALTAIALEQGISTEQYARVILERGLRAETKPRRHISQVIRDNMRGAPPEMLEALPIDGASEHDHYIYGLPKRNS